MSEDRFIIQSVIKWGNPFNGSTEEQNTFITVCGKDLENFRTFKEKLGIVDSGIFSFKYYDEDLDLIPISSENEFTEFAKVVRKRTARGLFTRLVVHCTVPLDENEPKQTAASEKSNMPTTEYSEPTVSKVSCESPPDKEGFSKELPRLTKVDQEKYNFHLDFDKLRAQIVQQVKSELLSEMKELPTVSTTEIKKEQNKVGTTSSYNAKEVYYTGENQTDFLEKRPAMKIGCGKKDSKLERCLEKLEGKKNQLLASESTNYKTIFDLPFILPNIMSGEASKESMALCMTVTVGKPFTHIWCVTNDGTLPWDNVELRHSWSSPELEPINFSIKCPRLLPGQECQLAMEFQAPMNLKTFGSVWNFYHEIDSQLLKFGHYVSVIGYTKMSKHAIPSKMSLINKVQGENEAKRSTGLPNGNTTIVKSDLETLLATGEQKVLNGEPNVTTETPDSLKKKLDGRLASAKIAAEMAMEAARIAKATAMNKKSIELKNMDKGLNECAAMNNLDESNDSETDPNNEDNDTDGFEFVVVNGSKDTIEENCVGHSSPEEMKVENGNNSQIVDHPTNKKPLTIETSRQLESHPSRNDASNVSAMAVTNRENNKEGDNTNITSSNDTNHQISSVHSYHATQPNPMQNVNQFYHPYFWSCRDATDSRLDVYQTDNAARARNVLGNYCDQQDYSQIHYNQTAARGMHTAYPEDMEFSHNYNQPYYDQPFDVIPTQPTCVPHNPASSRSTHYPVVTCEEQPTWAGQNEFGQFKTGTAQGAVQTPPIQANNSTQNNFDQPIVVESGMRNGSRNGTFTDNGLINVSTKQESNVHILPQGLVEGAINVASSAYNTACKALSNLRATEGVAIKEFDPVFENNLALLVDMGFNNVERNARLLKRFNNDINQVVSIICASAGSSNLDID